MGYFMEQMAVSRRMGVSPPYEIGSTGISASVFWKTCEGHDELNDGFFTEFYVRFPRADKTMNYWISAVETR